MTWLAILLTAVLTWDDNSGGLNTCYTDSKVCDREDGFKIERDRGSGFVQVGTVGPDIKTYTDNTAQRGDIYRVGAYNKFGMSYSASAIYSPPLPIVPDAVKLASVTYLTIPNDVAAVKETTTSIRLTWSKVDDPTVNLVGQRSLDGSAFANCCGDGLQRFTTIVVSNLGAGSYQFRLRVRKAGADLGFSNETLPVTLP